MFWKNLFKFKRSPTLASARWLANFLRKDTDRFMQRYPVLAMTPDQAYRAAIARVLEKIPEHIPIATKLAIAITVLLSLAMLGLSAMIGTNQSRMLDSQVALLSNLVTSQLSESAKRFLVNEDLGALRSFTDSSLRRCRIVGIAFYSPEWKAVVAAGAVPSEINSRTALKLSRARHDRAINWTTVRESTELPVTSVVRAIRERNHLIGHILVTFDRSSLDLAKKQTREMIFVNTLLMIAIGIFASYFVGNWLTRPISDLIRISRAIVSGNYDTKIASGNRNDEIGILIKSINTMGQYRLRKEQVEQVFSRYVSDSVAKQVLEDLEKMECLQLGCEHVQASVVFADIAGFSTLSETASPKEVSELLNLYFTYIAKAVRFCNGHIDKYIGDCAMIVFGAPVKNKHHAQHAVACAWMIQQLIECINHRRSVADKTALKLRIGINSGTMVAGNMGSSERMNYTVVGDKVNIASRLSHAGRPGEIILTEDVLKSENLSGFVKTEFVDTINLRGRKEPISIRRVVDINIPIRNNILREIARLLDSELSEV